MKYFHLSTAFGQPLRGAAQADGSQPQLFTDPAVSPAT